MRLKTRIHELRREKGITQEEIANLTGVRRETISLLELGKYNPSLKLGMDIAKILGRAVEDVFEFCDD